MDKNALGRKQIEHIAGELLAYCQYCQQKTEESHACLEKLANDYSAPEDRVALGLLCARAGKWDQALSHWKHLTKSDLDSNGYAGQVSNGYIKAAIFYSEQEKWDKSFQCLAEAKAVCSENPVLNHVPARIESDLPLIYHEAGDYEKAIDKWVGRIKTKGNGKPDIFHLIAISALSWLHDKQDMAVGRRIELIRLSHMCWCALAGQEQYWEDRYADRKEIYGEAVSLEEFKKVGAKQGLTRCQYLLDRVEEEAKKEEGDIHAEKVEMARHAMAVEEQSAILLARLRTEKRLDGPSGGFSMLSTVKGKETFEKELHLMDGRKTGSPVWLLKGLKGPSSKPFLRYLTGGYQECIELCETAYREDIKDLVLEYIGSKGTAVSPESGEKNAGTASDDMNRYDRRLRQLAALAAIAKAENALEGKQCQGCRQVAKYLSEMSGCFSAGQGKEALEKRAKAVLGKMVPMRLKVLRNQGLQDDAIELCKEVLKSVSIFEVEEALSSMFLKRSETRFFDGDLDGFLEDYDEALLFPANRQICESHLKKCAKHHLSGLYGSNDFSGIRRFLSKLRRYRQMPFVRAQQELFEGMELMLIQKKQVSHPSVFNHFEKAYQADQDDTDIVILYSMALSNKGVDIFNDMAESSYNTTASIHRGFTEATSLLLQALKINPQNEHAIKNLAQITQVAQKSGVNVL